MRESNIACIVALCLHIFSYGPLHQHFIMFFALGYGIAALGPKTTILPCQITTLLKARYHTHTANIRNEVCTLSNYDNLDDTVIYCGSVTMDDFGSCINEIAPMWIIFLHLQV